MSSFTLTGVSGSFRYLRMSAAICDNGMFRTLANERSSWTRNAWCFGRSDGQICTAVPAVLVTSTRPKRSRIRPRCACTRTVRSWLFSAARRYCVPESTCNAHSRRKRAAKTANASTPRTPIRSASRGVSRYGSAARGSGGRKRRDRTRTRLAKQPHLSRAVRPLRRRHHPADERVDGNGQQEVDHHSHGQRVDEDESRRRRLPEHEVQDERAELVQHGDHGDREQRRVCAVATGRLAVATRPVTGE